MHLSFSSLVLLGLSLGLASSFKLSEMALERGDCPTFWFPFKDRCYKYMASPMSWIDAEIFCLSQGSNLVSIHSQEEQEFVKSLIGNFDPTRSRTWTGLRDKDKDHFFMWTDGCPLQFENWQDGEPNNHGGHEHCVDVNGVDMLWNDITCTEKFPFVCASRKPVC
ncbi:hypothetical protein WMY93_005412 [Mugilogobius chulae]|uniref:C-type lectin domain-containing protein n=1 Tax=Mugilogobius chulae TaxID=88201 RepID=A0AAW0PH06_9GOBI